MTRPRFAAHRGGAALWPENSLLAFRNATALGAPLLECDVHLTADGDLAVIHDRTLERTTDGAGLVVDHTAPELRMLRLKGPDGALSGERLPMLADLLDVVAPSSAGLLVEVKGPSVAVFYQRENDRVRAIPGPRYEGLEERLIEALASRGLLRRAAVMAFNPEVLARVHAVAPAARTTLLVGKGHVDAAGARAEAVIEWARWADTTDLGLEHTLVDALLVERARAEGMSVGVWTVNDEAGIRRFVDLGVDVITTDRPDLAARALLPEGGSNSPSSSEGTSTAPSETFPGNR